MTVMRTNDRCYLRRWMMRPAFLRRMGVAENDTLEIAFQKTLVSGAVFFSVIDGEEKGCIIFSPEPFGWSLHLCVATWWRKTRIALREAIKQMRNVGQLLMAKYPIPRRSLDKLLDDTGFSSGYLADGWRVRTLTF